MPSRSNLFQMSVIWHQEISSAGFYCHSRIRLARPILQQEKKLSFCVRIITLTGWNSQAVGSTNSAPRLASWNKTVYPPTEIEPGVAPELSWDRTTRPESNLAPVLLLMCSMFEDLDLLD